MTKKLILISLICALITANTTTAFADVHYTQDVTMTVTDEVINTTTERLFGFNQEWTDTGVRRNLWLDKNYAKFASFANDFENTDYSSTPANYAQGYFTPGATKASSYINNGDTYGGNASYTSYTVTRGQDLYEGQYTDGVLNHPAKSVTSGSGSEPIFSYINKDILTTGGFEGYMGFNAFYEIKSNHANNDAEDLTVVSKDSGNHALKLAPARGYEYTETNKDKKGLASFFGKNNIALIDRQTVIEYRINVASAEAEFRHSIAKDCNFDKIIDSTRHKYVNALTMQFIKEFSSDQKRGWYDCFMFKDGKISIGGENVGEYTAGEWYDVRYTLDIKDGESCINTLEITDSMGKEVCSVAQPIELTDENSVSDIYYINTQISDPFEFASRSDYGYMFSSHSAKTARENSTVYIDDIAFYTEKYYDNPAAVLNTHLADFKDYPFPYTRVAGGSANAFKWKMGLGDAKSRERYSRQRTAAYVSPTRAVWGIPEWYRMVNYMNTDAEFSYVINILDSNEDIIDLIEFMTAEGDIDGDGEDWAQVRRDNGIIAPLRVYMWEIGNEPDINHMDPGIWEKYWDLDSYLKRCGEIVELLNTYCPDVKVAVPVNTSYISNIYGSNPDPSKNWDDDILAQEWATDIDYLSYHSYNADRAYPIDLAIDNLKANIYASGNEHIKIAYTEHGTGRSANAETAYQGVGLASALIEAQFFNRVFREPIVDAANLHSYNLYPARWGIGYVEDDGSFAPGASYELMKMYAENGVGDVLYTVMDGFEPEQTEDKTHPNYIAGGYDHTAQDWTEGSKFGYSCSAVKQADGSLNLFVSNSRNHTLNLTLDISDAFADYDIVEHSVITGKREEDIITSWDGYVKMLEGYDDSGVAVYSTQYAKDMVYTTEIGISSKDRLTISPYSVNVIKLKNTQLTAGSAKFRGQHRLDISGCVKNATDNRDVTLFIENKDTHEIYHIAQTKLNGNNCYNFNFEFAQDIGDCNVIINYCGAVKNITDDFAEATDTSQMFEITGEITEQSVNAVVNNKFGFLDVNALMLAQGIADNGAFGGVRISDRQKLLPGENVFSAKVPENYGIYKLYFWENLINLTPIFKSITIN